MNNYLIAFEEFLKENLKHENPKNLYNPVKYILESGGKRLRPLITVKLTDILLNNFNKALPAAASLEVFHNFTLAHDDIMDNAKMRRGKETMNSKWNNNTAILSGDVMLILAYELLNNYEGSVYKELNKQLTKSSRLVCEGQQSDMDFSTQKLISEKDYFEMIQNKTAELIACSFLFSGIISNSTETNKNLLYEIGLNLGIAFQLEDDYLDCFGDEIKFGKKIGGDILEKKKTLMFISTNENLDNTSKKDFEKIFYSDFIDKEEKIKTIKSYYVKSGSDEYLKNQVKLYYEKSINLINQLEIDDLKKNEIISFSKILLNRQI
jgi:geranylgeranyl diphosphate synthase type II